MSKVSPVQHEADITAVNILLLKERPVNGKFDAQHLCEINRRILQGIPVYNGGVFRISHGNHVRSRAVSNGLEDYVVHYRDGSVTEDMINGTLEKYQLNTLGKLPEAEFAKVLASIYADLDHIHAFNEANSRTLRIFTEQIASQAGYKLDWTKTNLNENERDTLYMARDIEVSKRSHPGLTVDTMRDASKSQYEAYDTQKKLRGAKSLEAIFADALTKLPFLAAPNPERFITTKLKGNEHVI